MFICNHCPYVLAVVDKLVKEGKALRDLGFGVAAICSNDAAAYPEDSYANMGAFAREHHLPFPYLHDVDQTRRPRLRRRLHAGLLRLQLRAEAPVPRPARRQRPRARTRGARRELYEAMRQVADTGAGPARADAVDRLLDQVEGRVTVDIRELGPADFDALGGLRARPLAGRAARRAPRRDPRATRARASARRAPGPPGATARVCGFAEIEPAPLCQRLRGPAGRLPRRRSGWRPHARRTGVGPGAGRHLAQRGPRARAWRELCSDALIDNHVSHAAHRAWGFAETERVVYFRLAL